MTTLKISELSVGDWVEIDHEDFGWHPAQINVCGDLGIGAYFKDIDPDEEYDCTLCQLRPIPITAEILEKNGFERLLERDLFYHSESGLEVAFEDGEWMHTINLHEYTINTISGVHHIQHLLRLYGCEEEINL